MGKFWTGIRDNHPGSAILLGAIYPTAACDASGLGELAFLQQPVQPLNVPVLHVQQSLCCPRTCLFSVDRAAWKYGSVCFTVACAVPGSTCSTATTPWRVFSVSVYPPPGRVYSTPAWAASGISVLHQLPYPWTCLCIQQQPFLPREVSSLATAACAALIHVCLQEPLCSTWIYLSTRACAAPVSVLLWCTWTYMSTRACAAPVSVLLWCTWTYLSPRACAAPVRDLCASPRHVGVQEPVLQLYVICCGTCTCLCARGHMLHLEVCVLCTLYKIIFRFVSKQFCWFWTFRSVARPGAEELKLNFLPESAGAGAAITELRLRIQLRILTILSKILRNFVEKLQVKVGNFSRKFRVPNKTICDKKETPKAAKLFV